MILVTGSSSGFGPVISEELQRNVQAGLGVARAADPGCKLGNNHGGLDVDRR